ncbi:MAG: hypothetical protein ACFNLE_02985, partial [Rothia aeria]
GWFMAVQDTSTPFWWFMVLSFIGGIGVDGEGVQVGEGDVDWAALGKQLRELAPKASFIPEIWQGHINNGEGFFTALDRLEKWL